MTGVERPELLIPLDGSETAASAFGTAEALTRLFGGVLHVVHVTDSPVPVDELPHYLGIEPICVDDLELHQITGDVVNTVLELALRTNACMIVMSSHGKTHDVELLAGSTTMSIIQHTSVPVLVVRPDMKTLPGSNWLPRKMLVPHDGSPVTSGEVDNLFDLAAMMGVDIDVLHVAVVGRAAVLESDAYTSPTYLDYPHYDWSAWSEEFIRRLGSRQVESRVRLVHTQGDIVQETLAFADRNQDDLIALIWHGRMEKERASTVKGILQNSQVPVLLKRIKR